MGSLWEEQALKIQQGKKNPTKPRQDLRDEEWWEMEEILWAGSKVTLGFESQMFAEEKISQSS